MTAPQWNILHLTHTVGQGDSEGAVLALATGLDPSRFRVAAAVPREGWLAQRLQSVGITVYDYEGPGYPHGLSWTRLQRLARIVRRCDADVMQCHSYPLALYAAAAARLVGCRSVISVGGPWDTLDKTHRLAAHAILGRMADVIATPSEDLADELRRRAHVPPDRLRVIPNGVDCTRFRPQDQNLARARLGLAPTCLTIATLGHLRHVKGHSDLLGAMALVDRRLTDWRLLIAGSGPLAASLQAQTAALGLDGKVLLLGQRSDPEDTLAACDIFVLPSLSEGMSGALLQALACARPVVATRVGGNKEVVTKDVGVLVPPRSPEHLAQAILDLASQPKVRAQLGAAGRRRALERYGVGKMIHSYEEVYTQRPPRRRPQPHPLRVVVSGPTEADGPGGQAVQAALVVSGLERERVQVRFVAQNPRLPKPLRLRIVRAAWRSMLHGARLVPRVAAADAIHIFAGSGMSFLLFAAPALLVARLLNVEAVLNYHCGYAPKFLPSWWGLPKRLVSLADRVVVPSRYLRDVFSGLGLRVRVVPNVVDAARFRFRLRRSLSPTLLCPRGVQPLSDTPTLLRAFAAIQRRWPAATLTIAGEGSDRRACQELVRSLGLQGVQFTGTVSREEMARLYQRSDILANSPLVDNMPTSLLEAFASGLPVVTTRAGGIPYLVEHGRNGLLVDCGDHAALAREVLRLLDDPLRAATLVRNARDDVERFYLPAEASRRWVGVYRGECMLGEAVPLESGNHDSQ